MLLRDFNWESLKPDKFEELCADLLRQLGFDSIRQVGGPGDKGRDILCQKQIAFGPSFAVTYTFVVQCKHTLQKLRKDSLKEDLAKAEEHDCDFWWLMTTARLSANERSWLAAIPRSKYGFGIEYVDRPMLEYWLSLFPSVAERYFPGMVTLSGIVHGMAIDHMSKGDYAAAASLLLKHDDGAHPRYSYLLACSYSKLAEKRTQRKQTTLDLQKALGSLREAKNRRYVKFVTGKFGWPEKKALYEIHRDPELRYLRTTRPKEFKAIFRHPRRGGGGWGGCFPKGTLIAIDDDRTLPIEQVMPGQAVVSVFSPRVTVTSRVICKRTSTVTALIEINRKLRTTCDQPLLTKDGWTGADYLASGDVLVHRDKFCVVRELRVIRKSCIVYQLKLDGVPSYYAAGYLAHNTKT